MADLRNLTPLQMTGLLQVQGALTGQQAGLREGTEMLGLLQQQDRNVQNQAWQDQQRARTMTMQGREDAAYASQQAAMDPNSAVSQQARAYYAALDPNLPITSNMSASDLDKLYPQYTAAAKAKATQDLAASTAENTQAFREATLAGKEADRKFRADKQAEVDRIQKQKELAAREETEAAESLELASINTTVDMFENALTMLEKGNVNTGPILEMIAPVSPSGAEDANWLQSIGGVIRKAVDPEVETINQVQARLNAEAKKLYDLGVMSKDDWNIMDKMSIQPGVSEEKNMEILRDQLDILKSTQSQITTRQTARKSPATGTGLLSLAPAKAPADAVAQVVQQEDANTESRADALARLKAELAEAKANQPQGLLGRRRNF